MEGNVESDAKWVPMGCVRRGTGWPRCLCTVFTMRW